MIQISHYMYKIPNIYLKKTLSDKNERKTKNQGKSQATQSTTHPPGNRCNSLLWYTSNIARFSLLFALVYTTPSTVCVPRSSIMPSPWR